MMADTSDVLYKDFFEGTIILFCRLCNNEVLLTELTPVLEALKQSQILHYLMRDPINDSAKACVRDFLASRRHLPQEFLWKFLAVVSIKISITPTLPGYINQSYTAKVIYNNTQPTTKLTNLTTQTRQDRLREDAKRAVEYIRRHRMPPQTIKIKMTDDTLPWCLNAIGDLNRTIVEGNRVNGYEMNNFVKTIMK